MQPQFTLTLRRLFLTRRPSSRDNHRGPTTMPSWPSSTAPLPARGHATAAALAAPSLPYLSLFSVTAPLRSRQLLTPQISTSITSLSFSAIHQNGAATLFSLFTPWRRCCPLAAAVRTPNRGLVVILCRLGLSSLCALAPSRPISLALYISPQQRSQPRLAFVVHQPSPLLHAAIATVRCLTLFPRSERSAAAVTAQSTSSLSVNAAVMPLSALLLLALSLSLDQFSLSVSVAQLHHSRER